MNHAPRGPSPWIDRARLAPSIGVVLVLVAARTAGFTTDSDAYLDVAANLRAGRGLVQTVVDFWRPGIPDPLGMWPPLYPCAVAAVAALGVAIEAAARAVSMAAFVAFAFGFHALAGRAGGRGVAFVAALLVLLAPPVVTAGASAWSESLYLALATWGIVAAYDLVHGPATAGRAALAGLLLGLAADARYLGLALVPVVVALLAAGRVRPRRLAVWAVGVALPVVPWLVHGWIAFGRPLGPPLPALGQPWGRVLLALGRAFRWEFLPAPLAARAAVAAIVLLGVAKAWLWAVRRPGAARWAAWIALVQIAAVGLATARYGINDPGGRYTVVAWPFLGLVAVAGAAAALRRLPAGEGRVRAAQVAAATLALGLAVAGFTRFLAANPAPSPDALARTRDASAMRALLATAGPGPVLSDRGHLLRLVTGRAAVQVPPPRFRVREFTAEDEARWGAHGVVTAVFAAGDRAALGPWLAARTAGGAGAWMVEDSAAGFVRFRVAR